MNWGLIDKEKLKRVVAMALDIANKDDSRVFRVVTEIMRNDIGLIGTTVTLVEYRAQFEAMSWDSEAVIGHRKREALASLVKQIPVEFEKLHERGYGTFYVARLFVMPHGRTSIEAEGEKP